MACFEQGQKLIRRPECVLLNSECRKVELTGDESKHRFPPLNPNQMRVRTEWIQAVQVCLGVSTWTASKDDVLCSLHFKEDHRIKLGSSWRLKPTAVPSKFLDAPISIQTPDTPDLSSSLISNSSSGFVSSSSSSTSTSLQTPTARKIMKRNLGPRAPNSTPIPKKSKISSTSLFPVSASPHSICDDKLLKLKTKLKNVHRELKVLKLRSSRKSKTIASLHNQNSKLKQQQKQYQSDQDVIKNLNFEMRIIWDTEKQRQNLNDKAQIRYSDNMKKLALSLQTQSPKCYEKLKMFLPLPHKSSICAWMSTNPCEPGINEDFLQKLYDRLLTFHSNYTDIGLMIDEMSIKQFLHYLKHQQKFVGLVDQGKHTPEGNTDPASKVLVLMASGISGGWKQVCGYVFVDSLNAVDQIKFLRDGVVCLKAIGFRIHSITSDGYSVNVNTFKQLGVDIHKLVENPDMSCVLTDPDFEGISVIFDPPHLGKCIRNGLDAKEIFYTDQIPKLNSPNNIEQKFFRCADKVQRSENIRFANKLTKEVIDYKNHIMKSRFVYEQFSNSVAVLLEVLNEDKNYHMQFRNVQGTVKFIKFIDKTFDLFNSRHKDALGFKAPWNKDNYSERETFLKEVRDYLLTLKVEITETVSTPVKSKNGKIFIKKSKKSFNPPKYQYIYETKRFGIILGLICTINSILHITKNLLNREEFEPFLYVLTYRFCQDLLEIFFGKLRGACGNDRNPTAYRIQNLMKRNWYGAAMLQKRTGNAQVLVPEKKLENMVLTLERKKKTPLPTTTATIENSENITVPIKLSDLPTRTDFYYISLAYIIGSSIHKIKQKFKCNCICALTCNDEDSPSREIINGIQKKNYTSNSSLIIPSQSTLTIMRFVDFIFTRETSQCNFAPRGDFIQNKIVNEVVSCIRPLHLFPNFDCSDEHKSEIIARVSHMFLRIRHFDFADRVLHDHRSRRKVMSKLADFTESRMFNKNKNNNKNKLVPATATKQKNYGRRISVTLKQKALNKVQQKKQQQQQQIINSDLNTESNSTTSTATNSKQIPQIRQDSNVPALENQQLFNIGVSSQSGRKLPNILRKQ